MFISFKRSFLCVGVFFAAYGFAAEPIYLPEIKVQEAKEDGDVISRKDMDRTGSQDLSEAVKYTPGIVITGGGARNESNFKVRGYGSNSVPIYIDGIVLANPYRREGDAARLLTGDLESITIQKGYSSTLLGANNLGGAVILRTAKPKRELEAQMDVSLEADSIFKKSSTSYLAGFGTKQELFYVKIVYQMRNANHFRLPASFEPTDSNPQMKGERLWSDFKDTKLTFIEGITPTDSLDIWFSYVYQDAEKGLSPPETETKYYQIWDWTLWRRYTLSLNADYDNGRLYVKPMVYYDKYDNSLEDYAVGDLKWLYLGLHNPPSDYDEYTAGVRMEAGFNINSWNKIQAAFTYKREDHKGFRDGKEEVHVIEDTVSLGGEYTITPIEQLTIKGGTGFDSLIPKEYWGKYNEFAKKLGFYYYIVETEPIWIMYSQAGIYFEPVKNHEFRLTYARKNHFPNMAQRYSTRFGDFVPNPRLLPEQADHFEFGYEGRFSEVLNFSGAVYYSAMTNKVVTIEIPDPDYPTRSANFSRNLDKVSFHGAEASLRLSPVNFVTLGGAFSYNKYSIDFNQNKEVHVLDYYPEVTANAYLEIFPLENLSLMPSMEYVSSRFTDTIGSEELEKYYLWHFKIEWELSYIKISLRTDNIFDTYYEIRKHYPMAGRTYAVSASIKY